MVDHAALQLHRQVPLGAPDQDGFEQLAERLVGDLGRDPQVGDLVLVLDHPHPLDHPARVRQPHAPGERRDLPVPGDGEVVLLHREVAHPQLYGGLGGGERGVRAGRHLELGEVLAEEVLAGVVRRQVVRQREQRALAGEQQGRPAGGAAGQVADVRRPGDQRRIRPRRTAVFPQTLPPARVRIRHGSSVRSRAPNRPPSRPDGARVAGPAGAEGPAQRGGGTETTMVSRTGTAPLLR